MKMFSTSRSGFSLTEVLVVIVILAILVSLAFPIASQVSKKMDLSTCAQNLKSVHQAIELYAMDHNGSYPGPSWSTFSAGYRTGDTTNLSSHLAPYLGYPETDTWTRMEELVCPAHAKAIGLTEDDVNPRMYRINSTDYSTNFKRPFGYSRPWGSATSDDVTPKRTARLSNPASEWMLRDIDVDGVAVHGNVRNYLYFDGHVEAKPLDFNPSVY